MRHPSIVAALVTGLLAACAAPKSPVSTNTVDLKGPAVEVAGPAVEVAGPAVEIAGTVKLEAGYALSHGARAGTGGKSLVFGDGEPAASENLLSAQSANADPADGFLLSNEGGSLISSGNAGIVSNNGGGYRLATAEDDGQLPAAGVALRVVSVKTGRSLPLNVGADGRPVYEILTNAVGAFRCQVRGAEAGAVRVTCAPPGSRDQRLHLDLLANVDAQTVVLDEDLATATRYYRDALVKVLLPLMAGTVPATPTPMVLPGLGSLTLPTVVGQQAQDKALVDLFRAKGVPGWASDRQSRLAYRIADVMMEAYGRSDALQASSTRGKIKHTGKGLEVTILTLADLMADVRAEATRFGAGKGDYAKLFAGKPFVTVPSQRDGVTYAIERPADLANFLVKAYLARPSLDDLGFGQSPADLVKDDPNLAPLAQILKDYHLTTRGLAMGLAMWGFQGTPTPASALATLVLAQENP